MNHDFTSSDRDLYYAKPYPSIAFERSRKCKNLKSRKQANFIQFNPYAN